MKSIAVIIWVALMPLFLSAQKATITGVVTDAADGSPLISANIKVKDATTGVATDLDGKYSIEVEEGIISIEFSYIGYLTRSKIFRPKSGETINFNIELYEETKQLGPVVVSGSKYEKKFEEEVISMEIIKPEMLQNSNLSADEALQKVPGFNLLGETASIRGGSGYAAGSASRVMILLDDLPILSAETGTIRWSALPTENIEQIEIIKGAASALYGSSALNGLINIRTANPKSEPYNKVVMNYGFYQQPENKDLSWFWREEVEKRGKTKERVNRPMFGGGKFVHRKRYDKMDLTLGGDYQQDMSYLEGDKRKRVRVNGKIRHISKKNPGLTVGLGTNLMHESGEFYFLWKGLDSLGYLPFEDQTFDLRNITIDPFVTYFDKKENRHSIKVRYLQSSYDGSGAESTNNHQIYGDYNFHKHFSKVDVHITSGASGYFNRANGRTYGQHQGGNFAIYTQAERKFFDKLNTTLGVRFEYFKIDSIDTKTKLPLVTSLFRKDGEEPITSPIKPVVRVGANYQAGKATFLRASFGQGFRFPTINEKFVRTNRSGAQVYPNPGLNPENGWNAEIGVKQGFKFSDWIGYFDIAGFITKYEDMVEIKFGKWGTNADPLSGFGFRSDNVENARISGVEISTFSQGEIFGIPFDFLIGYTYLDPKDLNYNPDSSGIDNYPRLKYRFRHSAKADIQTTYKNFALGISGFYQSHTEFIDPVFAAAGDIITYREKNNKGFAVFDARLGYELSDDAKINFIVKNVFNKEYTLRPGYLEAPRNYTFQLAYEF